MLTHENITAKNNQDAKKNIHALLIAINAYTDGKLYLLVLLWKSQTKVASSQDMFVSALFMDGGFGINNAYLPIEKLASNNEVWLSYSQGSITTKSLGLGIDDDHYATGLTEQMDYIKLMVTTQGFDTNPFFQEPLNIKGTKLAMWSDTATKGIMHIPTIQQFDWTAFLVGLHLIRTQN